MEACYIVKNLQHDINRFLLGQSSPTILHWLKETNWLTVIDRLTNGNDDIERGFVWFCDRRCHLTAEMRCRWVITRAGRRSRSNCPTAILWTSQLIRPNRSTSPKSSTAVGRGKRWTATTCWRIRPIRRNRRAAIIAADQSNRAARPTCSH